MMCTKCSAPLVHIPLIEAGDRYLLLCTNACFSTEPEDSSIGVPLVDGLALAKGTDSQIGSDVYPIDTNSESARPNVEKLLGQLRSQGMVERVWENIECDINGTLAPSTGS